MNATRRDLEIQFGRVVKSGWLPLFQREAKRGGTTTAHLLGIGSRETNLKNIRGDFRGGRYHGYGILQVDIGTDANYARAWSPENVEPGIVRGVDIYQSKVRDTKASIGKKVMVRSRSFVGAAADEEDLRRIATAAYNCGRWAHYHFSRGQNVDTTTTGDDYSRDVYDRAVEFADMLEERGIEKMAIQRELDLQGKYARKSHREMFGYQPPAERVNLPPGVPQEDQEELNRVDYEREDEDLGVDIFKADLRSELSDLIDGNDSTAETDPAGSKQSPSYPTFNADRKPEEAGPGADVSPGPADPAAQTVVNESLLTRIQNYGDQFQSLQPVLDKFGIAIPTAGRSAGTSMMTIVQFVLAAAGMAWAFMKDNAIWIIPTLVIIGIAVAYWHKSGKRAAEERAGLPVEVLMEMLKQQQK